MVSLTALWAPILLAAILCFVASFLIWAVLDLHRNDWRGLPNEPAVTDALRSQTLAPGQYLFPYVGDRRKARGPEAMKRFAEGPSGFLTILPSGMPPMGRNLALQFSYMLLISLFVAYLTGRTTAAGTAYLAVFRVAGTVATLAYAGGQIPTAIWFGRSWKAVAKDWFEGLVYGLLTAGAFGALWPS